MICPHMLRSLCQDFQKKLSEKPKEKEEDCETESEAVNLNDVLETNI